MATGRPLPSRANGYTEAALNCGSADRIPNGTLGSQLTHRLARGEGSPRRDNICNTYVIA
jgi:hypothetical protein